jgi:hypothetical protein
MVSALIYTLFLSVIAVTCCASYQLYNGTVQQVNKTKYFAARSLHATSKYSRSYTDVIVARRQQQQQQQQVHEYVKDSSTTSASVVIYLGVGYTTAVRISFIV